MVIRMATTDYFADNSGAYSYEGLHIYSDENSYIVYFARGGQICEVLMLVE